MAKDQAKIGAGHASAMFRQGLRELRSALYPDSNVAQPTAEYGIYGTKTPGEVAESRRADERGPDEEPQAQPVLGQREQAAQSRIQESLPRGIEAEKE